MTTHDFMNYMKNKDPAPDSCMKDHDVSLGNGVWTGPIYSLVGAHCVWLRRACYVHLGGACYMSCAGPVEIG